MRKRNRFSALMSVWRPRVSCAPPPGLSGRGKTPRPHRILMTARGHQSSVLNTNTFISRVTTMYTSVSALSSIFCQLRLKISRLRCFLSEPVLKFPRRLRLTPAPPAASCSLAAVITFLDCPATQTQNTFV